MSERSIRNSSDLLRLLLNRNSDLPNFALLLGAGASASSGVKLASQMVDDWRNSLYVASHSSKSIDEWLPDQAWYKDEDEYSILFELTYDHPAQRRVFIEECVKTAHPNWGYVYLTSLLAHNVFNVVLTTNFDDLINEACYLYSDHLRPQVAAHDSSIGAIRMSSERPKIIKLHGDFLYDNIKNTLGELETLESNTKNKLTQIAQESGLVVVGYGGRDRSVMDVLDVLLRSDHYFPHGVYWCTTSRPLIPNKRLASVLRRDRIHLVEIDGFDELMASVHGKAEFSLPEPLAAPLKVARERGRLFVNVSAELKNHPVISRDMTCVLREMDKAESVDHVPQLMQAALASRRGDVDAAIRIWKRSLESNPDDIDIINELAGALLSRGENAEAAKIVKAAPDKWANKSYMLLRTGDLAGVIEFSDERLKQAPGDWVAIVNRAIALKKLNRKEALEKAVETLQALMPGQQLAPLIAVAIACLRNDKPAILTTVYDAVIAKQLGLSGIRDFPVFDEVRDDPEFQATVSKAFVDQSADLGKATEPRPVGVSQSQGLAIVKSDRATDIGLLPDS